MLEDFGVNFATVDICRNFLSLLTFAESTLLHSTPSLHLPRLLETNLVITLDLILAQVQNKHFKMAIPLFSFSIGTFSFLLTSVRMSWSWSATKIFLYLTTLISSGGRICGHKEAFHQELVGSSDQLYIQVSNFIQLHSACLLLWMLFVFGVERGSNFYPSCQKRVWFDWS